MDTTKAHAGVLEYHKGASRAAAIERLASVWDGAVAYPVAVAVTAVWSISL